MSYEFPEPEEVLTVMIEKSHYGAAHALGSVGEKLGAEIMMAVACETPTAWRRIFDMAKPQVLAILKRRPPDWLVRIVLYDAFQDILFPRGRRPVKQAARDAHCAERTYRMVYRSAAAVLDNTMSAASSA